MTQASLQYKWDLDDFRKGRYGLTMPVGGRLAEACAVCLEAQGHNPNVHLSILGELTCTAAIHWAPLGPRALRSHGDPQEATEAGAYCVAILAVCNLTNARAVERSAKGTGIDYWVGEESQDGLLFQRMARLEVSGIATGTASDVATRVKQKKKQSTRSDSTLLPAYIVVVEFGKPTSHVSVRNIKREIL